MLVSKGGDSVCLPHPCSQHDLSHYLAERMADGRKGGWDYMWEGVQALPVSSALEYVWNFLEDALLGLLADGAT